MAGVARRGRRKRRKRGGGEREFGQGGKTCWCGGREGKGGAGDEIGCWTREGGSGIVVSQGGGPRFGRMSINQSGRNWLFL
jgi:hypothetical protein